MYEDIERKFKRNLQRTRNLADAYDKIRPGGRGRKSVKDTDILRASIVFLHASLEEVIRDLLVQRLPDAEPQHLDKVSLSGKSVGGNPAKFFLGELAAFKGKTVDEVIEDSVRKQMNQSSFNDVEDIISRLRQVNINYEDEPIKVLSSVGNTIKRRHNIVHQADANENIGIGSYHAKGDKQGLRK